MILSSPTNGKTTAIPSVAPVRKRPGRWLVLACALVAAIAVAGIAVWRLTLPAPVALVTTPVEQGTLARSITASGIVNPQNTILVGSQVSGTISEIDVDYNSVVRTGEVLARIDPTAFQAALNQAVSTLAQTRANASVAASTAVGAEASIGVQAGTANAASENVGVAQADVTALADAIVTAQSNVVKAQSALVLAQQTIARDTSLVSQGFIAQNTVDADRATLEAAQSGVTGAQGSLTQARSQKLAGVRQMNLTVSQSASQDAQNTVAGAQAAASQSGAAAAKAAIGIQTAQVATAAYNLAHATITSPVNGTVIARDISLGETVAASFSTPTLFTIAQDLSKMEVDLAVGEPDVGAAKIGDPVTFTVLAYPTVFSGTVSMVRQNPTTVSNVVTYTTVVVVDNKAGLLRPGMTANASVQTQSVAGALIVPLQALEWKPSAAIASQYHLAPRAKSAKPGSTKPGIAAGSQFGATMGAGATALPSGSTGRIFVVRSGVLVVVPVQIVLTSATQVAVKPATGALSTSDAVVTADSTGPQAKASAKAASPAFGQSSQSGGAARAVH